MNVRYWGKLILFGEYSMIYDSNALLIPMKKYCASWEQGQTEFLRFSRGELLHYVHFISEDPLLAGILDTDAFSEDLKNGWALASDIPLGYGLGSSGAVVAAVYERYARERITDPLELKTLFARMESYFHGSSSGIDPLQCYLGKPFRISDNNIQILSDDFLKKGIHIGLLDTKTKSDTKPLVEDFKRRMEDPEFLHAFEQEYIPHVSACIDAMICGDPEHFFASFQKLRRSQLHYLKEMIPDVVLPLFCGTFDCDFGIKILGSGGGGYMLVFAQDVKAASEYYGESDLYWLQ